MIVIFSVGKYRRRKIRPLGLRARLCAALSKMLWLRCHGQMYSCTTVPMYYCPTVLRCHGQMYYRRMPSITLSVNDDGKRWPGRARQQSTLIAALISFSLSFSDSWCLRFEREKLQLCGLLFVRASLYLGSIWKYPKWDSYKIRSRVIGMDTETPLSGGIWGRCRCLGWTRVSALGLQILGRLDKGEGGEGIRAPRKRWEIDWSSWRQESCPSQPLSVKYLFASTPPTYNIYTDLSIFKVFIAPPPPLWQCFST